MEEKRDEVSEAETYEEEVDFDDLTQGLTSTDEE